MTSHRHLSLAFLSLLTAAGLVIGSMPSSGHAAPFYYRWERPYPHHWGPLRHHPPKHVRRETLRRVPVRGPLVIVVSIAQQEAKIFSGTTEIATTPVSTGVIDHPTPTGVFSIIQKQVYHESNLYSAAPMPHMQRLTWSGIALHGGVVPGHPASHGCIRLPRDFAVQLYGMTKIGTRVVVTYDDATPIDIAHKALLQPETQPSTPDPKTAALDIDTISKMTEAPRNDVTSSVGLSAALEPARKQEPRAAKPPQRGGLSVFISRKQAKLYARYNFEPVLEAPISIAMPDKPIGTHVFTATELAEGGESMRWNAVSIPSASPKRAKSQVGDRARDRRRRAAPSVDTAAASSAAEALDRIDVPAETRKILGNLLAPGASLIISDNALSDETDADTDFVVLTQ